MEHVRVEGLLVSVRIHQRKDSRGDRVGGGRVGGGMDRGRRDCPAGYCFGLGWLEYLDILYLGLREEGCHGHGNFQDDFL